MPGIRIRAIKPEFFTLPSTAALSFEARILRIAMWTWANDHGYGETNLNGLLGLAFPDEDGLGPQDIKGMLREIAEHCDVEFYRVRGRTYFCISDWAEHQRIAKPNKQGYPEPNDPDATPDQRFYSDATESPGDTRELPGTAVYSPGTQGNTPLGTGERGIGGTVDRGIGGTGDRRNPGSGDHSVPALARVNGSPGRVRNARGREDRPQASEAGT